jgi:hypothetical protein
MNKGQSGNWRCRARLGSQESSSTFNLSAEAGVLGLEKVAGRHWTAAAAALEVGHTGAEDLGIDIKGRSTKSRS